MKILYVHGFGTAFDTSNPKVRALSKIGDVVGLTVDYTLRPVETLEMLTAYASTEQVDLIVGTSMGGWAASHLGAGIGVPFVAINPALDPAKSLVDQIGTGTDFTGKSFTLTEGVVAEYPAFNKGGCGLILLDDGDERFDASVTKQTLDSAYDVIVYEGGSHRFDHMKQSLDAIVNHVNTASVVYGSD